MNTYDAGLLKATEYCETDADIVDALKRHAIGSTDLMADAFCDLADHLDLNAITKSCQQVLMCVYPESTLVHHVRYLRAVRDGAIEQAEKLEDARYVA